MVETALKRNLIISFKKKSSLVTIPTQTKTVREERMLQVLYLYYCHCRYKYSTASSISKVEPIYQLPYQNTRDPSRKLVQPVRRGKGNKQKSQKTSLATDENQDVYLCDRLFAKPILVYSQLTISNLQSSYFSDEIADCIFYQVKEGDEYFFQIQFLIKQNQNVELYHVF